MKLTQAQMKANWQWMLQAPYLLNMEHADYSTLTQACHPQQTPIRNLNWKMLGLDSSEPHLYENTQPIIDYVMSRPHQRLGIQFEHLLACAINLCSNLSSWQRNVQITTAKKQTLGELDFLCRTNTLIQEHEPASWCHIESAVKFYLADCASPDQMAEMHNWVGPNRKDRLDLKVDRLLSHQLQLTDSESCRSQLQLEDAIITKQLFVKGRLYIPATWQPLGEKRLRHYLPKGVNTQAEIGWWCSLQQLKKSFHSNNKNNTGYWLIINRHAWMGMPAYFSPVNHSVKSDLLSSTSNLLSGVNSNDQDESPKPFDNIFLNSGEKNLPIAQRWCNKLEKMINNVKRPIQIMYFPINENTNLNKNRPQRYFVTPDNWSNHNVEPVYTPKTFEF